MEEHLPHPQEEKSPFDVLAERVARFASSPTFAIGGVLLVAIWLPTLHFLAINDAQVLIQTVLTIVTFLLVALLQNSQKRSEEAVNAKLNAIAHGVADLMRAYMGEDKDLDDNIERLAHSVGFEERVSTRSARAVSKE